MALRAQALTKLGVFNVPEWWDAGKVSNDTSGIPFGESLAAGAARSRASKLPAHSAAHRSQQLPPTSKSPARSPTHVWRMAQPPLAPLPCVPPHMLQAPT